MVYIKQKTLNKLNVNKVSPCATADAIAIAAGPDALDGCLPKGDALAPAWGGGPVDIYECIRSPTFEENEFV